MDKNLWLKNYPEGIPHEISPNTYNNVLEIFEQSCKNYSDLPAFENMGAILTYQDLERLASNFAAYLQNKTDLKPGDKIAIQMPNVLQYPVALYGAMKAGLIIVNTNPLYTPREMEYQFNDSGAKAIVIVANFANSLEQVIKNTSIKHVFLTEIGDLMGFPKKHIVNFVIKYVKKMVPGFNLPGAIPFGDAVANHGLKYNKVKILPDDIAFLQYTGGTTGVSKGAILNHFNIVANMEQMKAWMQTAVNERTEIIITPLPLYHIFSLTVNCLGFMAMGGKNVLITNPRDIPGFVKELGKHKFTIVTGVNTLFNALLNNPDFNKLDFSHLKVTVGGAMAIQKQVAEKWKQVTGCVLTEGYGLTESSPAASANPIVGGKDRIGTIGLPIPSTEFKLTDDDGNEVPIGEPGEIWIKGPQIMQGYYNKPDETAKVITVDGWLKTGDVAIFTEEGYFKIVDRKKDMILVSGFNVYPNEIEDVVASHPGVLEVAAVGVADEKSGEVVKIFVVKKDPNLTEDSVHAYCKENLTGYKLPKYIEFRTELPKTNVGKILRRALRDEKK
ncbi:MAG: AMP-binding protein [Bacteroidia bacterium]|nr:AMP-binding protein [Bacteroidia bacterium]